MKRCPVCDEVKPFDEFGKRNGPERKHRKPENAYRWSCKRCAREQRKGYPSGRWSQLQWNINRRGDLKISMADLKTFGLPEDNDCYLCGEKITLEGGYEMDHVLPRTQGGDNTVDNLRWTHRVCNRMKHDRTIAEMHDLMSKIVNHVGNPNWS